MILLYFIFTYFLTIPYSYKKSGCYPFLTIHYHWIIRLTESSLKILPSSLNKLKDMPEKLFSS